MGKYVVSVTLKNTRDAMSKAKNDVNTIANDNGYESIWLTQIDNKIKRLLNSKRVIRAHFSELKTKDTVLVQYPTYMGRHFDKQLFSYIKSKNCKMIAIIHDIDCLRFDDSKFPSIEEVISQLNMFSVVISSNAQMSSFLKQNGLKVQTVNLNIFDYLHEDKLSKKSQDNVLNFAGNLDKSKFLLDLSLPDDLKLDLFGKLTSKEDLKKSFTYRGSFLPEKLPSQFNSGYGLVWDGESSYKILGKIGLYQKYNNPHKVSLYLSSGLPVIIWEKAAMADFIEENNVGITISSLDNVKEKIDVISSEEYNKMVENATKISAKLTSGFYTKKALDTAEQV